MTRTQLTRLERLRALAAPGRGGVVHQLPGETPEDAVAGAVAAGRRGAFIVMPAIPSAGDWQRETVEQQVELAKRAQVFMSTGRVTHQPM